MPPEQRRQAIVEAVTPLFSERGGAVTSRQLAEAADVSEGTIFNVFADKDELIDAVIAAATDPEPTEAAIRAIASDQPFEAQLVEAARLVHERVHRIWHLLSLFPDRHRHGPGERPRFPDNAALAELMAAHADRLVVDPNDGAQMLRSMTLALTHPMMCPQPHSPDEIVDRFLYGCASASRPTHTKAPRP